MAQGQPIDTHEQSAGDAGLQKLFRVAIKAEASDLHLKVGQPPKLRIQSKLKSTTGDPLTQETIERYVYSIMSEDKKEFFQENGAVDFAHDVGSSDRFRINVFRQRGFISLAARHITSEIPPFESLHLPPIVEKIAERTHDGLILVTGPAGCGKSTTIASMIDYINRTRPCHIITIEDPLEFVYTDQKAIVSQREIGIDVPNYKSAIKSLSREDPDVVLIGEMRDNETVTAAISAAETGHLVFGTMHALNTSQTIQRILDMYPPEERGLARQTFALTIRAITSQELLPGIRKEAGIVPAVEILIANSIVRKLIAEERESDIPSVIRACQGEGMQDITESLRRLVADEWIDLKIALEYAPNVEELKMALKGMRTTSGAIL